MSSRLPRARRASHDILVRAGGGVSLRFVGHVDGGVGDRDRPTLEVRLESRFPGRAGSALHFSDDLRVERIRLVAEPFRPHQRLELRAAALVERVRDRRDRNAAVVLVARVRVGELREQHAIGVGSLHEALREPVQPGARELLHAEDPLRAVSIRLMAGIAVDGRPLEIVLVVHAIRGPVVLDLLGEQAREVAASARVVALLLEADQVEVEVAGRQIAARQLDELLAADEADRRHRGGPGKIVPDAREDQEPGIDRRHAIGEQRRRIPGQRERALVRQPHQLVELGEVADFGAPAAAAKNLGETVAAVAGAELVVGVLARGERRQLGIRGAHRRQRRPVGRLP